ncbi:MAG TPA: hypothetical protein PKD90_08010 [Phnomibacter sp.]|nr:hypothetical protein [Phnomibacter sp.]
MVNRDKHTIVVVLPRGEAIRNFLYTGIVDRLRKKYRIVLFAVVPNASIKTMLEACSDVFYELKPANLSYKTRLLYDVTDLAHNKYLWSEAAKVRWNMRNVEAVTLKQKAFRAFKKTIARNLATDSRLRKMDNLLLKAARKEPMVNHYLPVLQNENPVLVFNASHVHATWAYPLMQAARLLQLPTCAFLFSWDNLTSQGRIFPQYDFYCCWNEQIKTDLLKIYPATKAERIFNTGTPQFSFHFNAENYIPRTEFLKQLGLPPQAKYLLYSSGMSHHMPYEWEVAERIADMLPAIDPELRMVVRTYAKDKHQVFDQLKAKRPDIIIPAVAWEKHHQTPLPHDQVVFTNLLRHCEMGINVASTISLELVMLNKPAINVGYNPLGRNIYPYDYTRFYNFDHYKPIVESGAVTVARSEEEMKDWIATYLRHPALHSAERQSLTNRFFDLADGEERIKTTHVFEQAMDAIVKEAMQQKGGVQ